MPAWSILFIQQQIQIVLNAQREAMTRGIEFDGTVIVRGVTYGKIDKKNLKRNSKTANNFLAKSKKQC